MMPVQNKSIAIVGGGPGGLTLARLLQMKGANVKVYERDLNKDARVQGATLDLHDESGLRALREAGLMDAFEANYRPGADKMRIVDKAGKIIMDEHANGKAYEAGRPEIDRGPLRQILLGSLKPDTVLWNHRFVSLTPENESWILNFDNVADCKADLVIGADGANSKIRPVITPVKPSYAGITAIEGAVYDSAVAVPEMHELLKGGKIFAMGDEKSIIVGSKGDGSLAFYFSVKTSENWYRESGIDFSNRDRLIAWFKEEFAGWNEIWNELIAKAHLPLWPRPQYCLPLNQSWDTLPNLTMLGDAAHLMPPYAGEGVNLAMLDAVELAGCLTDGRFTDVHAAIAFYEKQMLDRASETAADTLENTAGLHGPDGTGFMMKMFEGI